ncbi:transcriptional regulator, AsnC family [Novosphingobium aromaticivorans DSM 12444]|uniref:Transcriptional regulator, AsnC family n=2 Tax=Novosphingobium aromaticivorans TaxID=48935 RepID=Q2GA50_NOVAD|nr:transcriptional regulator, AsnC family [Novosphingobium aromaticivorans DSM 12444]SCX88542.1 transcriptional regulator, AsnC family [Novosphingobium aromaticivorans]
MHSAAADSCAGTEMLLQVTVDRRRHGRNVVFDEAVRDCPEVLECLLLSGDMGYWLRVRVASLADYEDLRERLLTLLPGVQRITASVVLQSIVGNGAAALLSSG